MTFKHAALLIGGTMMSAASVAASAQPVLPSAGLPSASARVAESRFTVSHRASTKSRDGSQLLGAPLLFIVLGAIAVTIGTVIIVHNGSSSG